MFCKNNALFYIIVLYYHFNIPTEGPFRCADTHLLTACKKSTFNKLLVDYRRVCHGDH